MSGNATYQDLTTSRSESRVGQGYNDAVDLPTMVQVVCRFQADELLDRLPSA
jgi:hypothetical protein